MYGIRPRLGEALRLRAIRRRSVRRSGVQGDASSHRSTSCPETLVIPGYPLIVGQDFGRNPWSLIGQVDHMGRLLIHQEVPATNMGLEKHVEQNLRPQAVLATSSSAPR